jgi:hypothetical protein
VEAGGSYYFEIGMISRTNADAIASGMMEVSGRPLVGRYSKYSGFMFYALDAAAGATAVASLNSKN